MNTINILIVDDDENTRKTFSKILKRKGYNAEEADTGAKAVAFAKDRFFHIVALDVRLPDLSGLDVLCAIMEINEDTVVIMMTGYASLDSSIEAMNKGAYSYITKPLNMDEVLLVIERALEKQRLSLENKRLLGELKRANEELKALSLHDPLTLLANRRLMDIGFNDLFARAKRFESPFSVLMMDIDHFKVYNDTHGHLAGDNLLVKIAGIISKEVRILDLVVRYGGEEFLILLSETDITSAYEVAERMRKKVETEAGITVSIGVSSYNQEMDKKEELINKADNALYQAKQKGKNRVEMEI